MAGMATMNGQAQNGQAPAPDAQPHAPNAQPPAGRRNPPKGNGHTRRAELAAFLRTRRERITPEQAGLPPGLRRRTPGLRREEVAQLAGVGVTWYTWLEQGRPINASVQVLTAIARTLRLDGAEREHLYRLAGVPGAAGNAEATSGCEQVPPEVRSILDTMVSLPASVLNERFDLLAWNHAYAAIWPGVTGARAAERNVLWLNFTNPDCCHPYINRDEQLPMMVAQLRANYARHLGEPAWASFVRRLQAASPYFARLWDQHEVASSTTYLKVFRHPAFPRLVMTTTSLAVLSVPGTRVVVHTPADETTREALDRLIAGEGKDARYPCWEWHQRRLAAGRQTPAPADQGAACGEPAAQAGEPAAGFIS